MSELSNEDNAGAELLHTPLVANGEGDRDEDDDSRWLDTDDDDDLVVAGSSTVTTRNRELAAKKSVGLGSGERKRPPGFLLGSSRW